MIVEEPNTPIDEDTTHFIDDTLSRLSVGRTLIILPHRLSSVQSSDFVIVLHNGRVRFPRTPEPPERKQALSPPALYRIQRVRDRRN